MTKKIPSTKHEVLERRATVGERAIALLRLAAGPRTCRDFRGLWSFVLRISFVIGISCLGLAAVSSPAGADDELLKQYLQTNLTPIDLSSALRLAGVQNSQILLRNNACSKRWHCVSSRRPNSCRRSMPGRTSIRIEACCRTRMERFSTSIAMRCTSARAHWRSPGERCRFPGSCSPVTCRRSFSPISSAGKRLTAADSRAQCVSQDTLLAVALGYIELVRAEGQHAVAPAHAGRRTRIGPPDGGLFEGGTGAQGRRGPGCHRAGTPRGHRHPDGRRHRHDIGAAVPAFAPRSFATAAPRRRSSPSEIDRPRTDSPAGTAGDRTLEPAGAERAANGGRTGA